jgi:hypothetical protein
VAAAQHYKESVSGQSLPGVVAGASLSFHVFKSPFSFIEGELDMDEPANNVVMTVGPDVLNAVIEAAGTKDALGKAKKADELFDALKELYNKLSDLSTSAKDAFQPDAVGYRGCIFSSAPACGQLFYDDGLNSVYTYTPPGGGGLSGLPVPILFVVYNKAGGVVYVDTPVFLPLDPNK